MWNPHFFADHRPPHPLRALAELFDEVTTPLNEALETSLWRRRLLQRAIQRLALRVVGTFPFLHPVGNPFQAASPWVPLHKGHIFNRQQRLLWLGHNCILWARLIHLFKDIVERVPSGNLSGSGRVRLSKVPSDLNVDLPSIFDFRLVRRSKNGPAHDPHGHGAALLASLLDCNRDCKPAQGSQREPRHLGVGLAGGQAYRVLLRTQRTPW
mmetsp:Transcript_182609/g.578603  ORF Transcript_182609/g.578603 Transcript_182609/m.578603 type:complete len:211 (-) Transcript_182609:175-807(-)